MAFSLNSSANHQNQITRKKIVSSPLSSIVNDTFQAKCAKELNKLRSNCRKTLQQDLTRLFDEEIFADTFIEGDTFRKPCHSCILVSRAPHFYSLLVNYFDSTSSKHSKRGFNSYRLPSDIDCKEITDFLQKVYCHEDICLDTSLIIDKLSFHISKMSSESGIDKKSVLSSCEDNQNELIKEDSLEDFKQVGNDGFDKDSLKPADSLELVTDSLNNISLSSEDNKNDRQSTDYEDSLAIGQKDGGLTSSESSQMVRSGTFDMLVSIPLEDQVSKAYQDNGEEDMENDDKGNNFDQDKGNNRISTGIENGQDDRPLSVINLRHQIDSLELDLHVNVTKEESTKDSLDDENEDITTDGDAATPIAEAPESLTTCSQSSSLFQFFVDIDSMSSSMPNCKPQEKSENSMTSSGFMFIDLNSDTTEEQEKSRTIERDKNKSKDKRVPQIGPQEDRVANIGSSLFMKTKEVESRASSSCGINTNGKTGGTKHQQISNNVSSSKSVNYRKKSGSSFVLRGSSSDCRSSSKSRAHHTNRRTTSPMSSWIVVSLIGRLIEQCVNFVAGNYDLIVASDAFISLGRANSWNISAVEETFLVAMNNLTPEIACKTLIKLSSIISISENEEAFGYGPYAESYVALVRKMYRHCERFLVHNVNQAVTVTSWSLLPVDIQQRIKDSAIIVFEFDKPLAPRPQLSSSQLQSLRKKRSSENSEPTSKATSSTSSRAASRSRLKSNENRNQMYLARSSSDHIYDEVSFEQDELTSGATSLPVNPMSDHRDYRSQGKSSKMSPSFNRRSTEINDDDFDDALFSNNGRQIDQEMSRQTVKQDISRRKSPQSTPVRSSTNLRPSSRSRSGSTSSVSRSLASRPPFK